MRERFHAHGRPSLAFARKLAAACFLLAPFVPVQAFGYYEEAHVIGDEVKVTVDTAGSVRA